jgi:hypothetical protein
VDEEEKVQERVYARNRRFRRTNGRNGCIYTRQDSLLDLDYITYPVVNVDKRERDMLCMYLYKSFLVALLSLDAPQREFSRIEGE